MLTLSAATTSSRRRPVYGGTFRLMSRCYRNARLDVTFADARRGSVERASRPDTAPHLRRDADQSHDAAHRHRARSGAGATAMGVLVVDNTFVTPVFQRPLGSGADIVFHSITKYLNGHSDMVGGTCSPPDRGLATGCGSCRTRRAASRPDGLLARPPRHQDARRSGWRATTPGERQTRRWLPELAKHPAGCGCPGRPEQTRGSRLARSDR